MNLFIFFFFCCILVYYFVFFFFFFSSRRRHTRWPRDWSSDVCSSDLEIAQPCLIRDVRVAVERDVDARRRGGRGRGSRLGLGAPATRRRCLAALRR